MPQRKIFITQSNYIPWKGYFDNIAQADVFVIYDDMQYTKNDWRNRNKIKTPHGLQWLTIPVKAGKLEKKINQTIVSDPNWTVKHWKTLKQNYAKAPFFEEIKDVFYPLYSGQIPTNLSEINQLFISAICDYLFY